MREDLMGKKGKKSKVNAWCRIRGNKEYAEDADITFQWTIYTAELDKTETITFENWDSVSKVLIWRKKASVRRSVLEILIQELDKDIKHWKLLFWDCRWFFQFGILKTIGNLEKLKLGPKQKTRRVNMQPAKSSKLFSQRQWNSFNRLALSNKTSKHLFEHCLYQ
jgi:hypothetical protein